ncbi:uncharacterized protein LOC109862000 [Pseudomyrmex gracilis]|uniref:uncharacterized protein LOC109862000 n=1 Tax=Pseudomyrmex gracilis TaxID=219809 RepID=UPI00099514D3|nr:uncharacterized protein LOC109862000 [Pseudomyrmex gracilis]
MYDLTERVFLVKTYYSTNHNLAQTLTSYGKSFNVHRRKLPKKSVILRLVKRFEQTGSVLDDRVGKCGAKRTARTPQNIEQLQERVRANPRTSLTRLAQEIGVSSSTTYRMMTEDIDMFPYKIQMLQTLSPLNEEKRLAFATTFGAYLSQKRGNLPYIWFSDEAHFWLNGYVNKQNCRIWSTENPHEYETTTLHPQRADL